MADEVLRIAQAVVRNCSLAVFPCREDKRPACPRGFKDASHDPATIADLWQRYPGPLIGVATGTPSGISVLDLDVKGDACRAWWRRNEQRLPVTRTYRTRSGGMHMLFQHRPGIVNTAGKIAPNVDTRGDGGYIIFWFAAGCECIDHSAPASWPHWLIEDLLPKPATAIRPRREPLSPNADRAIEGIVRTVAAAQEGSRNSVLHWAAHRMRERTRAGQVGDGEAQQLLTSAALAAGLPAQEIMRTITSAWRSA